MGDPRYKPDVPPHHKPNLFSCFGFSRISKKITLETSGGLQVEDEEDEDDDGGVYRYNDPTKKSKRWLSWARKSRLKKSGSASKTVVVPFEYSTSGVITTTTKVTNKDNNVHAFTFKSSQKAKTDSKLVYKSKKSTMSNGNSTRHVPSASDVGPHQYPRTSGELKRAQVCL